MQKHESSNHFTVEYPEKFLETGPEPGNKY